MQQQLLAFPPLFGDEPHIAVAENRWGKTYPPAVRSATRLPGPKAKDNPTTKISESGPNRTQEGKAPFLHQTLGVLPG